MLTSCAASLMVEIVTCYVMHLGGVTLDRRQPLAEIFLVQRV